METNWKIFKKLLFVMALIASLGLNAFSQQVNSDWDKNIDFSKFKTYDFRPGRNYNQGRVEKSNNLMDQKVFSAVAGQMNAHGLTQSADNPDLIITYTYGVQTVSQIESMAPAYAGPGWYTPDGWWAGSWSNWWVNTYDQGTLIIDVKDSDSENLVYRVYGAGDVKKPKKQQKEFDKIAEKGFKEFPR